MLTRPRGRRGLASAVLRVVATWTLYAAIRASAVAARSTATRRLKEIQGCQPNELPREQRCEFVRTHASCRPEDGWIPYLEVHYCYLKQMEAATTMLFLLWIAVLFGLMMVVAERFFCPSLELISEYLRLPPSVAGATLLSFGNGAPDVFTQLAAISQGDSDSSSLDAISMALSEPLGSGLFVGNIVFALVVFFSGLQEIRVHRSHFLKDCLFYLGGVGTVFAFLIHGVVMVWEVALLAIYYLSFIAVTVLLSRGDEPVHADPRLHEVPHRLKPLDSFMRESFRRIRDFSIHSVVSHASDADADSEAPLLGPSTAAATTALKAQTTPQQHRSQLLRGPNLERIEEGLPAPGSALDDGEDVDVDMYGGCAANVANGGGDVTEVEEDDDVDLDLDLDLELMARQRAAAVAATAAGAAANGGGGGDGGGRDSSCSIGAGTGNGIGYVRQRRDCGAASADAAGTGYRPPPLVLVPAAAPPTPAMPSSPPLLLLLPPPPPSAFHAPSRTLSSDSADAVAPSPHRPYGRSSLDATSSLRRENSGKPPGRLELMWRRLERPGLAALSLFMPRVAIDSHARYRKTYAVLLPPLLPTLVGAAQGWLDAEDAPGGFWHQRWWLGSTAAGLVVAAAALCWYPRKGHLHGTAAGIATVVVFCEAMFLLDASAGELVSAAVALGQIFGISPSLLGATLLAWGNSVSDLVSNITLAKDGLPSMAITACFASPLFVLLAGLVTSLTYATRHGTTELPHDLALRVLYGCSCSILLTWTIVVPLVFRFRLGRRVGMLAVALYALYQALYIWAVVHDSKV